MFDDAISMLFIIWSSLSSWFTPTILFLFLNLMIGTIFITSSFSSSPPKPHHPPNHLDPTLHHPSQHQQQPPPPSNLARAPSLLHRLKSVNFYSYSSNTAPTQQHILQNLSSTSNPSVVPHELGLSGISQKAPAHVQTRDSPELGHSGLSQKVPARVEARELPELGVSQTHARPLSSMRMEKLPAWAQTRTQTRAPVIEEDMTDDEEPTLDEIYNRIKGTAPHHLYNRQNSDTIPAGGDIPVKLPAKMKKSASEKSAFNHFEAETTNEYGDVGDVAEATMEEMEKLSAAVAATVSGGSGSGGATEVDAMADDFINRFKKQLELQRNESIVRYKDMITRGSEK